MISKEQILKSAALAKLRLTKAEEDSFAESLASIVAYVDELKNVTTDGVEPVAHVVGYENSMRDDALEDHSRNGKSGRFLVEQSPRTRDGFLVVPRIFGEL